MPEYTFPFLFEPLKANSSIQTIFDTNTLVAPIKAAIAGYIATLGLPAAETAHLSWENCGAAIYLEQLVATYHLPSLGIQTPAPALKRNSTLADKVSEISALNGQYPKCQLMLFVRNSAADPWQWKNTEVIQNYGNRANTLDLIPYLSQGTLDILGKGTQIGIQFIDDPVFKTTLPAAGDRLSIKGALRVEVSQFDSKKNDLTEQLLARMAALELALEGRLVNLPANVLLGRNSTSGIVETVLQTKFATPAMIDQAIIDLVGGAPGALNTLIELASALNNDANFGATVTNALATKVSKTGDETINGIKTFASAIKTPYLERDIILKLTTGVTWTANNWYTVPGLTIPYALEEIRPYLLTANYQYNDGANSYSHWQMGGSCFLLGGIAWKSNNTSVAETIMTLQDHNGSDTNTFTFRTLIGYLNRGLEIKSSFNLAINGLGFIEFALKRI
ncbi:hypothetical protein QUA35_06685 [Microcoleus sp. N9_B2]|uniref:hypothetical protein n=1 Tax=unclassified Microcoleus TaxID=2642155 RepID=UPI002FD3832D